MSICYDEKSRVFKLDTARSSYVFMVEESGYLSHLHYGGRIDDLAGAVALFQNSNPAFSPYPEDSCPEHSRNHIPQEYSTSAAGDFRLASASVRTPDGCATTDFKFAGYRIIPGKPELPGLPASYSTADAPAETLEITLRDAASKVEFVLAYSVFEKYDVIARSVKVVNASAVPVDLERAMSLCLDLRNDDFDFIHLAGSWALERHVCRSRIQPGLQGIASKRTSSSHQHNPAFAIAGAATTEEQGEAWGCVLVYSGSFECMLELDEVNNIRAVAGINHENFRWRLAAGESFQTPEALLTYSGNGLGGMSRNFHAALRNNLCREPWKNLPRPILINNWEATYFDFNVEKLLDIARSAAPLGIEMLVLDDGWFGHREDDRSSLGDWFVNTAKIGELGELVKKVNALGMKFGLWFEPEMISKDSELYRKHPEWALTVPGRTCTLSRNQMVLDMTNPAVVDYLFDTVAEILRNANIEYIKWDMNRQPAELFTATLPAEKQGEIGHRFVLGMYELKRRLLEAFPKLLIEGCSGGGGRFDAGMLYYTPQIWTSDDTDAIERVKIQSGTSLFYPASAMGAHVSAVPNHQTGRVTSFETRGNVALAGTLGYEMDLGTLNEAERELVRRQTRLYREYNDVIARGELYRLIDPFRDNDRAAWEYAAADGSEAVVTYVVCRNHPSAAPRYLRLRGLKAAARYRETETGLELAGSTLMNAGFQLPGARHDGDSWIFHFVKL